MTDIKTGDSVRFRYKGVMRELDNIDIDDKLIVGFEMRKSGKFAYNVKKFRLDRIEGDIIKIDPPKRSGPAIGRP